MFVAVSYPVAGPNKNCNNNQVKRNYQLDLITPGISPLSANDRKQRRQMPNLRM
jgi:hypothetical protein